LIIPSNKIQLSINEKLLPTQLEFVRNFAYECLAYFGGWGSGKSFAGAPKTWLLANLNRKCGGIVTAPSMGMLKRTALQAMRGFLGRHKIPYTFIRGQQPVIIFPWGNRDSEPRGWLYFLSSDNPDALKGPTLAYGWMDEAGSTKSDEAWMIMLSRMRDKNARCIQSIITTTAETPWLKDRFHDSGDKNYAYYRASSKENVYNRVGYVDSLLSNIPANMRDVFLEGGFLPPGMGLVYESFDRRKNVTRNMEWRPNLPIILCFDFGKEPNVCVIAQKSPDGRLVYVFDQIVLPLTTPALCKKILSKYGAHSAGWHVYGDPAGQYGDAKNNDSHYDIIKYHLEVMAARKKVYYRYRRSDPGYDARAHCTNFMLETAKGEHRLLIHPRCYHVIYDLEHLAWSSKGDIDKTQINRAWGWTLSHASDGLAYFLEYDFPIIRPTFTKR